MQIINTEISACPSLKFKKQTTTNIVEYLGKRVHLLTSSGSEKRCGHYGNQPEGFSKIYKDIFHMIKPYHTGIYTQKTPTTEIPVHPCSLLPFSQ